MQQTRIEDREIKDLISKITGVRDKNNSSDTIPHTDESPNPQMINSLKFTILKSDKIKTLLLKGINAIWGSGYSNYLEIVLLTFVYDLTRNKYEKLLAINTDCPSFQLVLNFKVYLENAKFHREQCKELAEILVNHDGIIQNKNYLKDYVWNKHIDKYKEEIKRISDALESNLGLTLDISEYLKKLEPALGRHPEKILEAYDFSKNLNEWCLETGKRIISQIAEIEIIRKLQNDHNLSFAQKLISLDSQTPKDWLYREDIENAIREIWSINPDEDVSAVVLNYLYFLICKENGKELLRIKKAIVDEKSPYISLYPFTYAKKIKTWMKYEEEGLHSLLYSSAKDYVSYYKRIKYKEERRKYGELLINTDEIARKNNIEIYLNVDQYDNYIKRKLKETDRIDLFNAFKLQLKNFTYSNLLIKYDFETALDDWCEQHIKYFIEGKIWVDYAINSDEGLNQLIYQKCKTNLARRLYDQRYLVNDKPVMLLEDLCQSVIEELTVDGYKRLKAFQFDSLLSTYIIIIANGILYKEVRKIINPPVPRPIPKSVRIIEERERAREEKAINRAKEAIGWKSILYVVGKFNRLLNLDRNNSIIDEYIFLLSELRIHLVDFTYEEELEKKRELVRLLPENFPNLQTLQTKLKRAIKMMEGVMKKFYEIARKNPDVRNEDEQAFYDAIIEPISLFQERLRAINCQRLKELLEKEDVRDFLGLREMNVDVLHHQLLIIEKLFFELDYYLQTGTAEMNDARNLLESEFCKLGMAHPKLYLYKNEYHAKNMMDDILDRIYQLKNKVNENPTSLTPDEQNVWPLLKSLFTSIEKPKMNIDRPNIIVNPPLDEASSWVIEILCDMMDKDNELKMTLLRIIESHYIFNSYNRVEKIASLPATSIPNEMMTYIIDTIKRVFDNISGKGLTDDEVKVLNRLRIYMKRNMGQDEAYSFILKIRNN